MLFTSLGRLVDSTSGTLLGGASRAVGAFRTLPKPRHPKGRVLKACLFRHGLDPALGVEFLDTESIDEVLVRESRSVGVPGSLPDIHCLSIRIPTRDGSPGDLLFATTGWGRLTRFVPTAGRSTYGRPMTTLLPYLTQAGPVALGARAVGGHSVELTCAVGDGEWRRFADLVISDQEAEDSDIAFDPALNRLPGLDN